MEFKPFPKIARLSREVIISEKLDGTNAQVAISDDGTQIKAGSRNRWIYPDSDNHGFALWVQENESELLKLGPGHHFGEWWGQGIGRNYGLKEKRFSLFNVSRWSDAETRPKCCDVVPVLWHGCFDDLKADDILYRLKTEGSIAAPGFMNPEGIVVFHVPSGHLYKKTLDKNDQPKWMPSV